MSIGEGTAAFVFTVRHDQSGPEHGVPDACTAVIDVGRLAPQTTRGAYKVKRNMLATESTATEEFGFRAAHTCAKMATSGAHDYASQPTLRLMPFVTITPLRSVHSEYTAMVTKLEEESATLSKRFMRAKHKHQQEKEIVLSDKSNIIDLLCELLDGVSVESVFHHSRQRYHRNRHH